MAFDNTLKPRMRIRFILLCAAVVLTIFSQMPAVHGIGSYEMIYSACWILLFGIGFLHRKKFRVDKMFLNLIIRAVLFVVLILIFTLFTGKNYISNETTSILLSVFICASLYMNSDLFTSERLTIMMKLYICCVLLTAISVYLTHFTDGFTFEYHMKNSFSPILLLTIILLIFYPWKKSVLPVKIFRYSISAVLLIFILFIRSRATIICVPIILCIILFNKNIKKIHKLIIISACVVLILALLFNDSFYEFLVNQVLLTNRDEIDLNSLSSGRTNDIVKYFTPFLDQLFTGIGSLYLDCFYVLSIYQYGVFGGVLAISIALTPLVWLIKNKEKVPFYYRLIIICFSVNGIFEGLTPIGPGVKCMLMWLLFGMYLAREDLMVSESKGEVV